MSVGGLGPISPRDPFPASDASAPPEAAARPPRDFLSSSVIRDDPALAAVARGEREVSVGERGPHVRALQDALSSLGHRPRGGSDGIFGRDTEAALAAFQRANGLPASGRLDRATILALDDRLRGGPERTHALPPPAPLTRAPQSYLGDRAARDAYQRIERLLWTGASWTRGIDLAVTDADTLAVLDVLETLTPAQYNAVLHALAATRVRDDPWCPTLLDKFIVRGTSQFGNAALSDRFCQQLMRKLQGEPDNKILRHISPDSVDRLKGWAGWQQLINLFA